MIATIPAGVGGPQRHVDSLLAAPYFREKFECDVWAVPDRYRGPAGKIALWQDTANRLSAIEPDIVYLNVDLSLAFWLALSLRGLRSPPVVVHAHNSAFESPRGRIAQAVYRLGVRACATRRLAVSPEAAHAMFGSGFDVALLPSLIDFVALHVAADALPVPMPRRRFTFVCVGRLVAQKNQALAIEALARLTASGFDADLILVGDGDDRGTLEALAVNRGVGDRVRITGELASAAPIYRHLADAVLVPSRYEGQSRVVAEAQSFGLPVLASTGIPASAWIRCNPFDRRDLPLDTRLWEVAMTAVMIATMADGRRPTALTMDQLDAIDHGVVGGSRRLMRLFDDLLAEPRIRYANRADRTESASQHDEGRNAR